MARYLFCNHMKYPAALCFCFLMLLSACKEDEPLPAPTINGFTPDAALPKAVVLIDGNNFSPVASENIVMFNGVPATIIAGSVKSLTVKVPVGASTGLITISSNGKTANSTTPFTVLTPLGLTSISPTIARTGSTLTIEGAGFSTIAAENLVLFNEIKAEVTSATSTTLTVVVPYAAESGLIEIKLDHQAAVWQTFTVLPTIDELSPASGAVNSLVSIKGSGFGRQVESTVVFFNGVKGNVVSVTPNVIQAIVPAGATTGTVGINSIENQATGPVFNVIM